MHRLKSVVLCQRLPNNALKGTRREASSCFAGIPAARPLARAFGGLWWCWQQGSFRSAGPRRRSQRCSCGESPCRCARVTRRATSSVVRIPTRQLRRKHQADATRSEAVNHRRLKATRVAVENVGGTRSGVRRRVKRNGTQTQSKAGVLSTFSPSKPDPADNGSLAGAVHRSRRKVKAVSLFEGRWYVESQMGLQTNLVGRMLL